MNMTQRYAHLAPDHRHAAVAKLNEQPTFGTATHLSWSIRPGDICFRINLSAGPESTAFAATSIPHVSLPQSQTDG
jgi:hypothetical protein